MSPASPVALPLPSPARAEVVPSDAAARIAVAAQGLAGSRPSAGAAVSPRRLLDVASRLGVVQIDSVNVFSRSHYLPFFSRVGAYDRSALDRLAAGPRPRLVEYWAHEASYVPVATHALLRWRMARAAEEAWGGMRSAARDLPHVLESVVRVVADAGPSTAAEVERHLTGARGPRGEHWGWNWSEAKRALEFAFWSGRLTSAGRTAQFERRYALPEAVLPASVLTEVPEPADAVRALVEIAARACGIATAATLRDYFRLRSDQTAAAVAELVDAGVLEPVVLRCHPGCAAGPASVPAYLHAQARRPARLSGHALLSPFDNLIWHRPRTEQLFGMRYRLEIYTPAPRRVHGYYVLPYLYGDQLRARVDLKADRAKGGGGVLVVRAAWREPVLDARRGVRASHAEMVASLADDLRAAAGWSGLAQVRVDPVGDLAGDLGAVLAGRAAAADPPWVG
ncbi:MAG: crosslink repair DNA glycosylase YcaQ family protein [Kineosporiaceae bacterium]